ncbi:MAG: hypothetical protein R2838_16615 [Caldilineaceae bacterium]
MNLLSEIQSIDFPADLPKTLLAVDQVFDAPSIADIPAAVRSELRNSPMLARMEPGQTVAVGVGSRGIANLPLLVKATVDTLREAGLEPYVVPAMGSHGGATAPGQRKCWHFWASPRPAWAARSAPPWRWSRSARSSTGRCSTRARIPWPRTTPSSSAASSPTPTFAPIWRAGRPKCRSSAWGKQYGAPMMHAGGGANFQKYLEAPAARVYEAHSNLAGALCVVENAYDQTALIVALEDTEIGLEKEEKLLVQAKEMLASIPFDAVDIPGARSGKNISGTGMDTNVVSRLMIPPASGKGSATWTWPSSPCWTSLRSPTGTSPGWALANVTTAAGQEDRLGGQLHQRHHVGHLRHVPQRAAHHHAQRPADAQRGHAGLCRAAGLRRMVFMRDTLTLNRLYVSPSRRSRSPPHPHHRRRSAAAIRRQRGDV